MRAVHICTLLLLLSLPTVLGDEDVLLSGSDKIDLRGEQELGNITLLDESTLFLRDATVRVNGTIRLDDHARLFVLNSTLLLTPHSLRENETVFHLSGRSMVRVKDNSLLYMRPQPTPTNTSYLLADDAASLAIIDSDLRFEMPEIINQSIENCSVVSGVLLLSGSATMTCVNSTLMGWLNYTGGELRSRWFLCTLHQSAAVHIESCMIQLNTDLNPIFKPVSGTLEILDSHILKGALEAEVTSELMLKNTTVSGYVNCRDRVSAVITDCNLLSGLNAGLSAPYVEVKEVSTVRLSAENSFIHGTISVLGNATMELHGCKCDGISATDGATISCSYMNATTVRASERAIFFMERCGIDGITLMDEARAYLRNMSRIRQALVLGGSCRIELLNTDLDDVVFYETELMPMLRIRSSLVGNVSFYDNVTLKIRLDSGTVGAFRPWRKGQDVRIVVVDNGSILPDLSSIQNVSIEVYRVLRIHLQLNGWPCSALCTIRGHTEVCTRIYGCAEFILFSSLIANGSRILDNAYHLELSYFGLLETLDIHLDEPEEVRVEWCDYNSPVISRFDVSPEIWNDRRDIFISVRIEDEEIGAIAEAYCTYSTDGKVWLRTTLFETSDGRYEASIPAQEEGTRLRIRIHATDAAGNSITSEVYSVEVGIGMRYVKMGLLALFVVLGISAVLLGLKRQWALRRYLKGGEGR